MLNRLSCGLCGLIGWLVVPILFGVLYLQVRWALAATGIVPADVRLPTDFLAAAVLGLGSIGLVFTCPLGLLIGEAVGVATKNRRVSAPAAPAVDVTTAELVARRRLRPRLWLLFGPSLGWTGLAVIGSLVQALAWATT